MEKDTAGGRRLRHLTQELNSALAPDEDGASLASEVYGELRRLAARCLRRERQGHTLQPTALVHEAFLQLRGGTVQLTDRGHFFRLAARAMRNLLIVHARRRNARKRDGQLQRVILTDVPLQTRESAVDLLALDEALEILERMDPRKARLIELKFFAGCTTSETAEALGVSTASVEREWRFARAWLLGKLEDDP